MANPKADRLIQFLTEQGITSPQVLAAIHALPREFFVAPAMMHQAYDNNALPIGQPDHLATLYRGEDDRATGVNPRNQSARNWYGLWLSNRSARQTG